MSFSARKDMNIINAMATRPKGNISDNSELLKIFCTLVVIILICIAIGHYAFKNGTLTCDHYILNTYLYVLLAFVLIFMLILLNDKYGVFNKALDFFFYSSGSPFIAFIVMILLIFGLSYALINVDPKNILASNAIWLSLVVLITIILIPTIYFGRVTGVVGMAGLFTVAIVIITGLLGYYYGDKIITFDWDYYLRIALFALIIVSFIGIFFITDATHAVNFIYAISILSLIIFVLLLLSYHKKLKENSEKCIDGQMVPNYPLESWKLVIKIVNVLQDLIRILGIRKMRRY
jgi:hypothetical protein